MAVILSFILPALTPITVRFFVEGAELQLAMGAMSLLFLVLMLESGHRVHKTTLKTLTLEVENQELIAHLSAETKRARDLNKELELEIAERQEAEEKLKKVRDSLEERVEVRTTQLRLAMEKVKVLRGLLPICSGCKKIRDDQGYWTQLEVFIGEHSEAEFTHGLCPSCAKELYPGYIEGGR